ncbi:MAG TPA: GTPase Era [Bacteroidota bacterium]|nr:GTPase Era [Bacteroidota bacterium]
MNEPTPTSSTYRCGYAAIIGKPNVGKSTLMNSLLKQKISIVTKKAQTTRHKILGILSTDAYQAIFLDTPGIIEPRYALHEAMMDFAASAIDDADLMLFMVDVTAGAQDADPVEREALDRLTAKGKPVYLVLNKIDRVPKATLLPLIDRYAKAYPFREIFPVSALTREGTDALLSAVAADLPEHPALYPADIVSEHNERFFVGEIIREKIFITCKEEIPYSTTVEVVEFAEREMQGGGPSRGRPSAPKWFISADIYVERPSQKGILIGKGGLMLKEIGRLARADIERFLDHRIYLELHVKVREHWREDKGWLQSRGYRR